MERIVHRTCTLCEACCGIEVRVEDGRIAAIRGDPRDPLSQGRICAKAAALQDLHEDPDRLRYPIRRSGGGWERIGWRDALRLAAEGILGVQRKRSDDAAAIYLGEPVVHNLGAILFSDLLVAALGTSRRFSSNSLDQFPKQLACHWMYGSGFLIPVPDVDRTDHLLLIGANPVVSNGSLMTAPGIRDRMDRIRERGGRIVVIDPRRSETAERADEHHFIRPGADPLLLAALIHCVFAEDRVRVGELRAPLRGLPALSEAVADFAPEAVSERVGISAEKIRELARAFAEAPSAVCYGRMGTSTVAFGTAASWLIEALNIVTGNFDRPGGAMFTNPPVDVLKLQPPTARGRWSSRTRGTPEFMGELPTATLAEEIETPGEHQVRALVTLAGNPVLSSPAGHRLREALAGLDFMVSIDFYLNETTRHADVILPPVGPLERDHFDVAFQLFSVRNTTRWSPAVFEPPDGTRNDAEIILGLASRLFRGRGLSGRVNALGLAALSTLGGERASRLVLDLALRTGPHGSGLRPWKQGITVKRLRRSAHGIDLGPLTPCLPDRLPDRPVGGGAQIDVAPKEIVADLDRARATLAETAPPLLMIGRREARTVNSWSHNLPSLVKGRMRCVLHVHPADAEALRLQTGDRVRVKSRVGAVEVPVELTDTLMRGVVSLPHGYGHGVPGTQMEVAAKHAGASMNELTDPAEIDPLSGTAVLSGIPVELERCEPE